MEILTSTKKRVLHITLNRPEKRNALTVEMCSGILTLVRKAQTDPDVGSILLCANGSVFCSGIDLDETPLSESERDALHGQLFAMGGWSQKPIVAAVNGAALGGGLGLVAQAHVAMASENAVFGLPEVRVGLWPFFVYRSLEAAIGQRRLLEASLTGHLYHPNEVLQWGLIHKICFATELGERAKVVAGEIAKASPVGIAAGLNYVRESRELSEEEGMKLASKYRKEAMHGEDFKEGVAAFKHKREPHWPSLTPVQHEKA